METKSILEHLHFGRIDFHKCSECSSLFDISGHVSTYSPATLYGFGTGQRLLHRMLLRCCSNENEIGKLRSDMAGPTLVHGQQIYESMTSSIPLLNHSHFWGASNIWKYWPGFGHGLVGGLLLGNFPLGLSENRAPFWCILEAHPIFKHTYFMAEHFLVFSLTQAALEIAARAALGDEQDVNQSWPVEDSWRLSCSHFKNHP